MPTSARDDDESSTAVVRPLLRRIEKLALTFLNMRFASPDDLWRFQLDLLSLQREIQALISDYKVRSKRDKSTRDVLGELRACRWYSRRLGDSLVWVLFGGDKKLIEPLSRNERIHVTPDGHGSRGMLIAARHQANQGRGFPLIHDITSCLRIGDITFIRAPESSEREYETVEIKTRHTLKKRLETERLAEYEYRIQIISAVSADRIPADRVTIRASEAESANTAQRRLLAQSGSRQLKRMSTALLHQMAELNVPINEEGERPAVWAGVNPSAASNWKPLQRVVRRARRGGYGSEIVDNAFLYCAFYSADGLSPASIEHVRLREDLANPALLIEDGSFPNVLSTAFIPQVEETSPQLFRPFYLYPIPRASISDLLYGRMMILVCFNEGRITQSLQEAGFDVEYDPGKKGSPLAVSGSCTGQNGIEYRFRYENLRYYFDEMIYEFRGRNCIVDAARTMSQTVETVVVDLPETEGA
jgi:hypothetical protein